MTDVTDPFLVHLRGHLKETGLSRTELARLAGISIHTMNVWYRDNRSPRLKEAVKISRALGVSIDELVQGRPFLPQLPDAVREMVELMLECDEPYQRGLLYMARAWLNSLPERRTH